MEVAQARAHVQTSRRPAAHITQTATFKSVSTAQHDPTQTEKLHWFTTSPLHSAYWKTLTEIKQMNNTVTREGTSLNM